MSNLYCKFPIIIITYLLKNYGFQPNILINRTVVLQLLQLSGIASIALIPYGFYYYHYGVSSLIVKHGFINQNLIGLARLFSVFFDFNQGMIIGFPGIMLSVGGILLLRLWYLIPSQTRTRRIYLINWSDGLLIAPILMLIPTLGQVVWNPGQEVFTRYAYWTAMPLIVWVADNLVILNSIALLLISLSILLLQFIPHGFFLSPSRGNYLYMKPQARWLIENFPGFYQPDPEIFAKR